MFRAGEVALPPRPRDPSPTVKYGAYDPERDCTVAFIMGIRRPGGEGWLLHANGEFLPFELTRFNTPANGEDRRQISFFNFGGSASVALSTGVPGRTLDDSSD